jgi:hypothetical protein
MWHLRLPAWPSGSRAEVVGLASEYKALIALSEVDGEYLSEG